jgi:hypothetical protein
MLDFIWFIHYFSHIKNKRHFSFFMFVLRVFVCLYYIHTRSFFIVIVAITGHTNFRNAGVHVKPKAGSAVFFSYIDPDTRITDTGLTEHSGCPVLEGEKKIVTQWIRLGVDDESPWDAFNSRKCVVL